MARDKETRYSLTGKCMVILVAFWLCDEKHASDFGSSKSKSMVEAGMQTFA